MKNHENRPPSKSDHFSLLTYAGSQLTFMTLNEKVLIFRHVGGVTTDLLDVYMNNLLNAVDSNA